MWRVVRTGRDVLDGSRGSGRWNTSEMSVLYGAAKREGAIAEIYFHLSRGQSVFPSQMRHAVFDHTIKMQKALILTAEGQFKRLGGGVGRYRDMCYTSPKEIGERER